MIPRNIFLMWDKPREQWPPLIKLCIELWEELNPTWNVQVFDQRQAAETIGDDVAPDILSTLKVQHQSDLLRTKLLATRGGIWADASCLPHFPVDQWIGEFEDLDFSSLPAGMPGQICANWFMLAKQDSYLMSRQYAALLDYWKTPKINLPQDERSIQIMGENWKSFISPVAAHELRIAPYFLWHYIFRNMVEEDAEFGELFRKQRFLSTTGHCGSLIRALRNNFNLGVSNRPLPPDLHRFLLTTDAQVSKLHHHSAELNYPFYDLRESVLERLRNSAPAA